MAKAPGSATKPMVPAAPTVPLSPRRPDGPGTAQPTAPLQGGSHAAPVGTTQMPQATVGMRTGGAPVAARPSPTRKVVATDEDEVEVEEKDNNAGLMPLSVAALVVALALSTIVLLTSDKITFHPKGQESALLVPEAANPEWEVQNADTGAFKSNFEEPKYLPVVPLEPAS